MIRLMLCLLLATSSMILTSKVKAEDSVCKYIDLNSVEVIKKKRKVVAFKWDTLQDKCSNVRWTGKA